ncbi:MAG: hypothetical protein ABH834_05345 [Candidatus Altiarchaeota archaeon]
MPSTIQRKAHLRYRDHSPATDYSDKPLGLGVKTFVFENVDGHMREHALAIQLGGKTTFEQTRNVFLLEALGKGVTVVPGEVFFTEEERDRYRLLREDADGLFDVMTENPAVENIRDAFVANATFESFRHELILRTIKGGLEAGDVEAIYGTAHSTLSEQVAKQGVYVVHEIEPQILNWDSLLMQRLMKGENPASISDIDYKRAMLAYACGENPVFEAIADKPFNEVTTEDTRFVIAALNGLIEALDESGLDEVIRSRRVAPLFSLNGIPDPSKHKLTRTALESFLDRNAGERPDSMAGRFWKN